MTDAKQKPLPSSLDGLLADPVLAAWFRGLPGQEPPPGDQVAVAAIDSARALLAGLGGTARLTPAKAASHWAAVSRLLHTKAGEVKDVLGHLGGGLQDIRNEDGLEAKLRQLREQP